jgi:5-(aminomethyl)-3-furanmethanol phosphate kinase
MWIVKLGGSLGRDPVLREWLDTLVQLGSGRVVIVPGGGAFADEVREHQDLWRFDDLSAHNMAVLAMAQMALMMQGICPALTLATSDTDLRRAVQQARVPVWLPFEILREQRDTLTNWGVTSDSLAAWLANRLNAEGLLLVKACEIEPSMELAQCAAAGIVDDEFLRFAREGAYPVTLLSRAEVPRVRELLLNSGTVGMNAAQS